MLLLHKPSIFLLIYNIKTSQDNIETLVYQCGKTPYSNHSYSRNSSVFYKFSDDTEYFSRDSFSNIGNEVIHDVINTKSDNLIGQEYNLVPHCGHLSPENTSHDVLNEKICQRTAIRYTEINNLLLNTIEHRSPTSRISFTEDVEFDNTDTYNEILCSESKEKETRELKLSDLNRDCVDEFIFCDLPKEIYVKTEDDIKHIINQYLIIRDTLILKQGEYISEFLLKEISASEVSETEHLSKKECCKMQINMRLQINKSNLEKISSQKKELKFQLMNLRFSEGENKINDDNLCPYFKQAFSIIKQIKQLYKDRIEMLENFKRIFDFDTQTEKTSI